MIIPKKLKPRTQDDILDEVSQELNIDRKQVQKTYDIWLDYMDYIANETDQCTIALPHVGSMFVSVLKTIRGSNKAKWKEFRSRKFKEIEKLKEKCEYIVHEKSYPIVLIYGLARRNKYGPVGDDGKREFFTSRDLINNQAEIFFEEDFEFSENKKLKKYFIDENITNN